MVVDQLFSRVGNIREGWAGITARVRVLRDVVWVLRVVTGLQGRYRRVGLMSTAMSRTDHRELAQIMRNLPGQYADRLPDRARYQIQAAAAAGQWEHAIKTLITVLRRSTKPVTAAERDQLHALMAALNMSSKLLKQFTGHP